MAIWMAEDRGNVLVTQHLFCVLAVMALFPFQTKDSRSQAAYQPMRKRRGPRGFAGRLRYTWATVWVAVSRLQTSVDPGVTFSRLKAHKWNYKDAIYIFHASLWIFWLVLMQAPLVLRLAIPILYITVISTSAASLPSHYAANVFSRLALPITSQL